jgi:hypothetical protein
MLTQTAAEVVRTLVEQSAAPDSGGLRIAASADPAGESVELELALVEEPRRSTRRSSRRAPPSTSTPRRPTSWTTSCSTPRSPRTT